jgi:hypothetical protein
MFKLNILKTYLRRNIINVKKGKVFPVFLTEHHAIKTYWRSGGIAPTIILTSVLDEGSRVVTGEKIVPL